MVFRVRQDNNFAVYDLLPKVISEGGKGRQWAFQNGTFAFKVREEPFGEINEIYDLPNGVEANDLEDAQERIYEIFDRYKEQERQGLEPESDTEIKNYPYDPKKINISNFNWSIDTIRQMLDKKLISLSPDFQRNFIWTYTQKSQLIESILLGIPVPAFYLAKDEKGRYHVIDGLQRLTTIKQFCTNEFSLKYLEYLTGQNNTDNLQGCYYKTEGNKKGIDQFKTEDYEFRLATTQLNINVISADTPIQVKFDIFRRINSGGKQLNKQEMRNCLMADNVRILINELAKSIEFKNATGESITTDRMVAQELVMRFIGFWYLEILNYKEDKKEDKKLEYTGEMQGFLDDLVDFLNNNKEMATHEKEIKLYFMRGMKNAYHLFGQYCFRKCHPDNLQPNSKKQLINKSLFTTWSILLSKYDHSIISKNYEFGSFAPILAHALFSIIKFKDESVTVTTDLLNYVSHNTNDKKSLEAAFKETEKIIKQNLKL